MRPCINERFCSRKSCSNPQACGDYVPSLAGVALVALLVLLCGCVAVDAVSLSINGHVAGQGFQNLSYAGELLNVSLSQNGESSFWKINISGVL